MYIGKKLKFDIVGEDTDYLIDSLPLLSGNILMTLLSVKNLNLAIKSIGPVRPSSHTKTLVPVYLSK